MHFLHIHFIVFSLFIFLTIAPADDFEFNTQQFSPVCDMLYCCFVTEMDTFHFVYCRFESPYLMMPLVQHPTHEYWAHNQLTTKKSYVHG